jgi:hypothetical protein
MLYLSPPHPPSIILSFFAFFLSLTIFLSPLFIFSFSLLQVHMEFDQPLYVAGQSFLCPYADTLCPLLQCTPCDWSSQKVTLIALSTFFLFSLSPSSLPLIYFEDSCLVLIFSLPTFLLFFLLLSFSLQPSGCENTNCCRPQGALSSATEWCTSSVPFETIPLNQKSKYPLVSFLVSHFSLFSSLLFFSFFFFIRFPSLHFLLSPLFFLLSLRVYELAQGESMTFRFFLPESLYCHPVVVTVRPFYGSPALLLSSDTPTPSFANFGWKSVFSPFLTCPLCFVVSLSLSFSLFPPHDSVISPGQRGAVFWVRSQ